MVLLYLILYPVPLMEINVCYTQSEQRFRAYNSCTSRLPHPRSSYNYAIILARMSGGRNIARRKFHRRCRNGEPRCTFPRVTTIFDKGSFRPMKIGFSPEWCALHVRRCATQYMQARDSVRQRNRKIFDFSRLFRGKCIRAAIPSFLMLTFSLVFPIANTPFRRSAQCEYIYEYIFIILSQFARIVRGSRAIKTDIYNRLYNY